MNESSFDEFVAAHGTALLRTAAMLTGDRSRAADLLQTALITVHRHWDDVADEEQASAAARRAVIAAHVRRRLWLGDLLAESPALSSLSGLPGFARPVPGATDELAAALAQLPARLRAAVVLRYGEGLTEPAAAGALACSVDECRQWTQLGLTGLDERLGGGGEGAAALDVRLRGELGARAAAVTAPAGLVQQVRDGDRTQRRHRASLLAVAGFLLLVVLVVVLTTG